MKPQFFKLDITEQEGNGAKMEILGDYTADFLTQCLAELLSLHKSLIPVFLDAAGFALMGNSRNIRIVTNHYKQAADCAAALKQMAETPAGFYDLSDELFG